MAPKVDREPWLLLIHQIPPKPDYFRVKVGRRLARIGAVAIKNSVYVLPATDQAVEDFQWILREITAGGGEASICRSTFLDGLTDTEIRRLFHEARARDYERIAAAAEAALATLRSDHTQSPERVTEGKEALGKLHKLFATVSKIDFFPTENRRRASEALSAFEVQLASFMQGHSARTAQRAMAAPAAGTWVTREGIFVDRIASAWLIRRFIDPAARFKFVAPQGYRVRRGEVRFDMFEAEYTHQGDRCTFETLLERFDLDDPALAEIAEIVHDIDLKDDKFGREDAAGVERVLAGIAASYADDAARLQRGAQLFDELYALLQREHARDRRSGAGSEADR